MSHRTISLLVAALAAGSLLAACGDDDDEGIRTLEEGEPEDFAEQGDAAFEKANRLAGEYGFQNCGGQEGDG